MWLSQALACYALLSYALVTAAPVGTSSLWSGLKRDVIVNVGDVTVVKQVVTTEVPTTVYMPVTVSGEATTIATVSTATKEVTTVVTATAIATKVERISVTEGVTVAAVVTTTAFNVQVAPIAIVTGPAVTVFQPSTVVQTIQGVPVTSVVTVMQTKSADAPPKEKGEKGEELPPPETKSPKHTEAGESKASASVTSPTASPTSGDIFNFNSTADAHADAGADSDAKSDADLDSTNTNSNNVTVIAGGSSDASEWFAENKWILIGVGCAILVLVIVGIVAIALGGKSHSEGGPPAQQSVVLSTPTRSVAAQPVANSLARPSRKRYARIHEELSSEMSDSSGQDEKPPVRRSSRSGHRSTVSRAGRRASF